MWRSPCNHWVFQILPNSILAFSQAQIWKGPQPSWPWIKTSDSIGSLFPIVNFNNWVGSGPKHLVLFNSTILRFVSAGFSRLVNSENHKCRGNYLRIWVEQRKTKLDWIKKNVDQRVCLPHATFCVVPCHCTLHHLFTINPWVTSASSNFFGGEHVDTETDMKQSSIASPSRPSGNLERNQVQCDQFYVIVFFMEGQLKDVSNFDLFLILTKIHIYGGEES